MYKIYGQLIKAFGTFITTIFKHSKNKNNVEWLIQLNM